MSLSGTKREASELEKGDFVVDTVMKKKSGETSRGDVDQGKISFSEQEKKKRSIYFHIGDRLCLIDGIECKGVIEIKDSLLPDSDITHFGVASFESKIFFVGGCDRYDLDFKSDKIFTFDSTSDSWLQTVVTLPETLASFPVVCCHKGHLFVFGTVWDNDNIIPNNNLAAFAYNINGGYWLSTTDDLYPIPPRNNGFFRNLFLSTQACFVYNEIIYFLVFCTADFCMYNLATKQWSDSRSFHQSPEFSVLRWSFSVAVIKGYIFYHFNSEIYCYDINNHVHYNLLQLPDHHRGYYVDYHGNPLPSFLVHAGNGLLYLFLPLGDAGGSIWRYLLQMHPSSPGSECPFGVGLVGTYNSLSVGYGISNVLEV